MGNETDFTRHALRTAVAQVCMAIGWTSIHQAPLNIMVDILHRYIAVIGRQARSRAELYGRSEANLVDLSLVLDSLSVNIPDLEEYAQHFEIAPAKEIPAFPTPAQDDLAILKPGSREVLHRPVHIHDHLPAMYPEMEEEAEAQSTAGDGSAEEPAGGVCEEGGGNSAGMTTPTGQRVSSSGGTGTTGGSDASKQTDDGCPLREISSVMMTSSGFLSPCREGKLPDSRTPHVAPDPDEKRVVKKHLDAVKKVEERSPVRKQTGEASKLTKRPDEPPPIQIKQEIPSVQVKQEIIDDNEGYEPIVDIKPPKEEVKKPPPIKPKFIPGVAIDQIMESVIQKGLRESEKYPDPEYSDGDWDPEADPKPPPVKKEPPAPIPAQAPVTDPTPSVGAGRGNAGSRKRKPNKRTGSPQSAQLDFLQGPQHFTANTKTPPKQKMARIPKITEKVSLPSPSSLGLPAVPPMGLGAPGSVPGFGMLPGQNPLIPQFPMNLYGFGGIPASLIPGFNPNLMQQAAAVALMQQAAAANAANRGTDDIAVTDDELEEGELSPPTTPTVPTKPEKEKSPDVEIVDAMKEAKKKEEIRKKEEEERKRKEEDRRKKEEERLKKEKEEHEEKRRKEKEREIERQKLLILTKERDRLREEEQKAKEKEKEKEREKEKEKEKEKERQREIEKEKEREKEREKEKEKEREREREKEKEKEREREKERIEKERLEQEKLQQKQEKESEKEKKKAKKDKKDKDKEKNKKDKKKEKKEKKKLKEKDRKPEEPELFSAIPTLKIKPPVDPEVAPTPTKPAPATPAPSEPPPSTPKLVIKNLPKEPPTPKIDADAVPMLGFQPLRTGPARTPKTTPVAKVERPQKRSKRPPSAGSINPPVDAGPSKDKRARETKSRVKSKELVDTSQDSGEETPKGIMRETVGSYTDEAGHKVWICPACGKQDDGSPMIGCDECDDWYHWLCVGINSEPSENQDWFCTRCLAKKQGTFLDSKKRFHAKKK